MPTIVDGATNTLGMVLGVTGCRVDIEEATVPRPVGTQQFAPNMGLPGCLDHPPSALLRVTNRLTNVLVLVLWHRQSPRWRSAQRLVFWRDGAFAPSRTLIPSPTCAAGPRVRRKRFGRGACPVRRWAVGAAQTRLVTALRRCHPCVGRCTARAERRRPPRSRSRSHQGARKHKNSLTKAQRREEEKE